MSITTKLTDQTRSIGELLIESIPKEKLIQILLQKEAEEDKYRAQNTELLKRITQLESLLFKNEEIIKTTIKPLEDTIERLERELEECKSKEVNMFSIKTLNEEQMDEDSSQPEPHKVLKPAKVKTIGSRAEVVAGTAKRTHGGLMAADLFLDEKTNSYKSKKASNTAKRIATERKAVKVAKAVKDEVMRLEKMGNQIN